jgi:hypothetical protein
LGIPILSPGQELDTSKVDQVFGRSGQKSADAYKVSFPRSDLKVTLQGVAIKPGLALGSWAGFSGSDSEATVMGDLVLLPNELRPVMEKLRESGIEVTGIHNHLIHETPRVMYMHYMGHGKATELAQSIKSALGASKTPLDKPATPAAAIAAPEFVKKVEEVIGRKGNLNNGVLGYGIPRAEAITMRGMTIPAALGLGETINFQEAGADKVATTGDFVLVASEVNPVIDALHEHHIEVTALHNHMLEEDPRLFFMHFWGVGAPQDVAEGIKAALAKIKTK